LQNPSIRAETVILNWHHAKGPLWESIAVPELRVNVQRLAKQLLHRK
jgi:hypothetical protein